jgi:hypothetical protein
MKFAVGQGLMGGEYKRKTSSIQITFFCETEVEFSHAPAKRVHRFCHRDMRNLKNLNIRSTTPRLAFFLNQSPA